MLLPSIFGENLFDDFLMMYLSLTTEQRIR